MISSERRHPTRHSMAWRDALERPARRRHARLEEWSFAALLLPIAFGVAVVIALRRGTGWTSPLMPLLGVIVCCGAGLIYGIDTRRRERPPHGAVRVAHTTMPGILAPVAVACSLMAALLTMDGQAPLLAALIWAFALVVLLGHALVLEQPKLHPPTPIDAIALVGLLAVASALRLPRLTDLPFFVHSDEAQMGLYTRLVLHGGMPGLFGTTNWWSVPWLGPAMQAPLMLVFGEGLWTIRFASVIAGVLATAGLWFLGSELWSRRAGFVAALLFAVLAPSVHFSRDGVHYMQSIAALVWTVLCYTRATNRYSGAYAALTGVLIGIDAQLYYAARLAIPLIFLHAALCAALNRGLLRDWLRIMLWTALGLTVSFLPMAVYYLAHPTAFAQRTDAVLIFGQSILARGAMAHDYGRAGWLEILGRQVQRVVLGFLALGDRSEQYGARAPLLDPVTAALLPAACALALARIRRSPWLLCALWLAITVILGGVLTTYQPDAPRLLAALPVVCLLIGGLAHTLLVTAGDTGLRDAKPVLALSLAAALVVIGALNADVYLDTYPAQAASTPITLVTDVAHYLSTVPGSDQVVLYDHREFYLAHWTIRLLAPRVQGVTVWTPGDLERTLAAIDGPFLLVSVDQDGATLARVFAEYPGGTPIRLPTQDPHHWVVAYRYIGDSLHVEHAAGGSGEAAAHAR